MKKQRNPLISTFTAQLTSTVSVALVLGVLGVVALMAIAARSVTREIKENMGFDVIMVDEVSPKAVSALKSTLTDAPFVANYSYTSPAQALDLWKEETGEDLDQMLGVNPFRGEFDVKVREVYANADSLTMLSERFSAMDGVGEVVTHTQTVEKINHQISTITGVLGIIAAALLLISFVLINNTVRLAIYARRFTIHTMKLVGATPAFIRRPFVVANALQGVVAAIIASGVLAGMLYYVQSLDPSVELAVSWRDAAIVFAGTLIAGVVICVAASTMATNKYLRLSYDDMFK